MSEMNGAVNGVVYFKMTFKRYVPTMVDKQQLLTAHQWIRNDMNVSNVMLCGYIQYC